MSGSSEREQRQLAKIEEQEAQITALEEELEREKTQSVSLSVPTVIQRVFQGPIPSPEDLERFGEVVPGLDDVLIEEYRLQSAHRREMEVKAQGAQIDAMHRDDAFRRGAQRNGLVIAIGLMILGAAGLVTGRTVSELFGGAIGCGALAWLFYGRAPASQRGGQDRGRS